MINGNLFIRATCQDLVIQLTIDPTLKQHIEH